MAKLGGYLDRNSDPPPGWQAMWKGLQKLRMWAEGYELADIDIPVLIVHGEEDVAVEPDRAEPMVDHLPDARMELIPQAGHTSNLEAPEAANAAIREFLDEVY